MSICVGIDPGLDGAVAVLRGDQLELHVTPVLAAAKGGKRVFDLAGMRSILVRALPDLVVIEKVSSRPGQGVSSVFSFGRGYGNWEGLLVGLGMPFQAVTPQSWQKAVLSGTARDKQAAIETISRRFPGVSLLKSPRSTKPHDGFADSACLAIYARQLLNGKGD